MDAIIMIRVTQTAEQFDLEMRVEGEASTIEVVGVLEMAQLQWIRDKSFQEPEASPNG